MDTAQKKAFRNRVDTLKRENKKLSEKLAALRKETQSLQRELKVVRKLLTEIPGPVILVQGQQIVFANEIAWKLLGFSEEELLGYDPLNLVHQSSSEYARTAFKKLVTGRPIHDQFEVYMRKKNGEPICCEVHWKKTRYCGRSAFLFNVTSLDQRKLEEKKLTQSQKIQAIARMASWLSRDFEKGFKVVNENFMQFQGIESVADMPVVRALRRFEAGMEIGNHISKKLSCLTRFKDKRADAVLFDAKKVLQDAIAITRPLWKEDGQDHIGLKTYLRTLSPVEGNPEELRDAFVTMILNAVDAMPEGGEIYLSTEENSGFAWIYIQDSGTGIPDEIRDKIYDPFFTTRGGGGHAGLGLSLAYAIISRHGGEIELISQEGQGTTFVVKLPLSQRSLVVTRTKQVKTKIRDSHILMVSAGSITEDLLVQEFVSRGAKVTVVYSCMEGLKLLKRKIFNLVVACIDAPDFDHTSMVKKTKQIKKTLPVVLVNAGENGRPFRVLKKLGADLIIERPLVMDRIIPIISETITAKAISE